MIVRFNGDEKALKPAYLKGLKNVYVFVFCMERKIQSLITSDGSVMLKPSKSGQNCHPI